MTARHKQTRRQLRAFWSRFLTDLKSGRKVSDARWTRAYSFAGDWPT